jgi:hypothetical protein
VYIFKQNTAYAWVLGTDDRLVIVRECELIEWEYETKGTNDFNNQFCSAISWRSLCFALHHCTERQKRHRSLPLTTWRSQLANEDLVVHISRAQKFDRPHFATRSVSTLLLVQGQVRSLNACNSVKHILHGAQDKTANSWLYYLKIYHSCADNITMGMSVYHPAWK